MCEPEHNKRRGLYPLRPSAEISKLVKVITKRNLRLLASPAQATMTSYHIFFPIYFIIAHQYNKKNITKLINKSEINNGVVSHETFKSKKIDINANQISQAMMTSYDIFFKFTLLSHISTITKI